MFVLVQAEILKTSKVSRLFMCILLTTCVSWFATKVLEHIAMPQILHYKDEHNGIFFSLIFSLSQKMVVI